MRPAANSRQAEDLAAHLAELGACRRCPRMQHPPVHGLAVPSRVMLIGQAPGIHEREQLRPFTWTAGRRLFGWFESIGLSERDFRRRVYMAAVARCFPGKAPRGGDRVPDRAEIEQCRHWLQAELELLRPRLLLLVGRLAIGAFLGEQKLADAVGRIHRLRAPEVSADACPLPHPSGASTWIHTDPGKGLLSDALTALARHPEWRHLLATAPGSHDHGNRNVRLGRRS